MEKDDFNKLIVVTSVISIAAISLGTYIINYSLSNYQLMDFDLLKPRAIIVGLLFLFFIAINIVLFFIFIDLNDFKSNSYYKILKHTGFKLLYASILFMSICNHKELNDNSYYNNFFGYKLYLIKPTMYLMFLYPLLIQFYNDYRNKEGHKTVHLIYNIFNYTVFIFMVLFSFSMINNTKFTKILYFNFYLYMLIATICGTILIRLLRDENNTEQSPSIFANGEVKNNKKFIGILGLILLLYTSLTMTNLYSDNIYMNAKQSLGGGKLERVAYVLNNDTITGLKIYETVDYVYLSEPDSSVLKLEWNKVERILKNSSN